MASGFESQLKRSSTQLGQFHRAFYGVLDGLQLLYREFVVLPPDKTPDEIEQNDRHWPYFADCIGALDGTRIDVSVPGENQSHWRNQKGNLSQNILGSSGVWL